MAGEQRTVTGVLYEPDGSPLVGVDVTFVLVEDAYLTSPASTYPAVKHKATTGSDGSFETSLVQGLGVRYRVILPDGNDFEILVPDGSATTLEALRLATEGASIPEESIESIIAGFMESYVGQGITVQDGDTTIVSVLGVLDFLGAEFAVTEGPVGEGNVALVRGTTLSTDVPAGNHTHDSRYYTESEIDTIIAGLSSGAWVKIDAHPFSAVSEVIRDNIFTATYRNYAIVLNIDTATSAGADLLVQFRTGGGSGVNVTTGYEYIVQGRNIGGNVNPGAANQAQGLITENLFAGAVDLGSAIYVFSPQVAARKTNLRHDTDFWTAATEMEHIDGTVGQRAAAAHTGIRFFPSAGTITGAIRTYGIVD